MKKSIILFVAMFVMVPLFSLAVPKLENPVTDLAGIISAEQEATLNTYLHQMSAGSPIQMAVLTVPSLEGEVLERYSMQVVDEWALGDVDTDMGALLLVALDEREIRIEVGYGLEGFLTDAESGSIIRNIIAPYFQSENYGTGILAGIQTMSEIVLTESGLEVQEQIVTVSTNAENSGESLLGAFLPFIIFIVIMVANITSRSSGGRRRCSGAADTVADIALISLLFGSGRNPRGGGGGFGGGGFGGFSGGGGGFGGGGASGGW